MRGDSEALLQAVRFLGMWDAIAVWECEGRSLFWDVGRAIAVWGMWGCDSASADLSVRCLGMLEGDSEALRRNRFLGMWGERSYFLEYNITNVDIYNREQK
ncbi:hypothetical protein OA07_11905 [Aphanizomenon flos-aquae 2012/KM1/D3]|nr:hypothetical protein OA07_11905 [Aphanizomenon flos-aquae 2012/KM1/D3]